jgi:hypothetical protein
VVRVLVRLASPVHLYAKLGGWLPQAPWDAGALSFQLQTQVWAWAALNAMFGLGGGWLPRWLPHRCERSWQSYVHAASAVLAGALIPFQHSAAERYKLNFLWLLLPLAVVALVASHRAVASRYDPE